MDEDLYPVVRTNLAMALMRSPYYSAENVVKAEALAHDVITQYPHYAEGWATLGIARSALQDSVGAHKAWERALELRPNYAEVFGDIGTDYAYNQQWDKAIEYYRRGLQIRPDIPVLWINLCIAYVRTDQQAAAEDAYVQAQAISPNHPQLWRCPFNLGRRIEAVKLRLEATRLRIEMMEQTPPELLERVPDQQFLELW